MLQDDQRVREENQATSLLVLAQPKIGERKVRLASTWLEHSGWETELIERRHRGTSTRRRTTRPSCSAG